MNFKKINAKVNQMTYSSQPTLAGWVNRLSEPQPIRLGKRKLGACAARNENNKQQKVDDDLVNFENEIRSENIKFNRSAIKFGVNDQTLRIKSVNVNSLISFQKMNKVTDLLIDSPDILALTDTRVKEYRFNRFKNKERDTFATNTDARGVAIIINRSLNPELEASDEINGNFLSISFDAVGKKYGLIVIYGPNEDNREFWAEEINEQIKLLNDRGAHRVILSGDLNIPLGKQIGYAGTRLKKKEALIDMMERHNLGYVAAIQNDSSTSNAYSFWRRKQDRNISANDVYQATRIDHFLTDIPINELSIRYLRYFPSDHAIVEMNIKTNQRSGKKVWKLNPNVLDDEKVKEKLIKIYKKLSKNLIKRIAQIEMSSLDESSQAKIIRDIAFRKWKSLVLATKMISNTWARAESKEKNKLKNYLIRAKENLEISNEEYELMSEELKAHDIDKNKIRSELNKVKNKIENKTLVRYKAMKNQSSRTIKELKIGDETYKADKEIRSQMCAHFTSTFRCDCDYNKDEQLCYRCRRDDTSYIKNIKPMINSRKKLGEKDKKELEKDIEEEEINKYVKKHFKKEGKSPGPDGIPYFFMFKMWSHLKKIVSTLIIKSFKLNDFPKELSEGLIVFLHKNGKPPNEIRSWRPLTLLNSIYKIASGVMAQRLKEKINKIVHNHQYGFVNGKNASDMIELLKRIMKGNDDEEKFTILLALDFKGAFDTVKHEAIVRALKIKVFGNKFVEWVAALLAKNESKLVINGRTDEESKVKVKRSARQGDPLSPYLFIIVLDELLERMDKDDVLEGIVIENKIINSLAFADDNYTAIVDSVEGIRTKIIRIKKIMEKFKRITGLTINVTKSEILCNDRIIAENLKSIEEIDVKTKIISLGIPIGVDASIEDQIEERLNKAFTHWAKMKLNLVERIEVTNALIIPKVLHLLRHLKFDGIKCMRWSKFIKTFIWDGKRPNIKNTIMEDDWSNGGWGLTSLKVAWLKLNVNWVLRSKKNVDEWVLNEMRKNLKEELESNLSDEVLSGPGKPVTKNTLESSESLSEAGIKIFKWTWKEFLKKEICFNHQPLINNPGVVKSQKEIIKWDEVPEVDFGPYFDLEALKEIEENVEVMDEDNSEFNSKLTANLLRRLKRSVPLPENEVCECRSKMLSFMEEKNSFKNFKSFLKTTTVKVGDQTVNRLSASTFLYTNINMNFAALRKQLKAANPRQNCLLNSRLILLRQKIKFRTFYVKQDLYRMNLHEIKDPDCEYCKEMESSKKNESMRHLLTECKKLNELWLFFRSEIKSKWNENW